MDYPGLNGFLGTRASLMLDVVFLAMFAVVPVMAGSIALVRFRRRYALHKAIQVSLGVVLALAVTLFEIDIRLHGWQERAEPSPYFSIVEGQGTGLVMQLLYVHLVFAVSSAALWVFVIVQALRKFPSPPVPCAYSPRHIFWARLAAIDMTLTSLTGWTFYVLAFVLT